MSGCWLYSGVQEFFFFWDFLDLLNFVVFFRCVSFLYLLFVKNNCLLLIKVTHTHTHTCVHTHRPHIVLKAQQSKSEENLLVAVLDKIFVHQCNILRVARTRNVKIQSKLNIS